MLALYLGEKCIGDNRIDGLEALDVEATVELNAPSSLTFTLPPTNEYCGQLPLMNKSEEIKLEIDGEFVFTGRVTKAQQNFDKSFDYECEGSRAYLNDVTLPVYSTSDEDVPDSLDGLFAWYVNHYNQRVHEQHQFTIGKNQAYLLRENNKVVRSSTQRPTVWAEIKEKLIDVLGGWVRVRYEGDKRYIDYLVTSDHSTTQRVEFGENLLDYARTQDMINYCTRLIPIGATPEGAEENITIEGLSDGYLETGFYKFGNAIVNQEAERKYGVIECVENFSDITLPENLQSAGLRSLISKQINDVIEINAVDLARLGVEDPINAGDYVRVISKPHSIDEYFICQKRTYHEDASQDTFQLGSEISNLTGKQTESINRLNASINKVYEKVDINHEDIKGEIVEVNKTVEQVEVKAETAQTTADTAVDKAGTAQEIADSATEKIEEAETAINQELEAVKTTLEVLPEMEEGTTLPQHKVVWSGKSKNGVPFNSDISGYEFLDIFYTSPYGFQSRRIECSGFPQRMFFIHFVEASPSKDIILREVWEINSKRLISKYRNTKDLSIVEETPGESWSSEIEENLQIAITKVVGWI